jgi:hypothetical protein
MCKSSKNDLLDSLSEAGPVRNKEAQQHRVWECRRKTPGKTELTRLISRLPLFKINKQIKTKLQQAKLRKLFTTEKRKAMFTKGSCLPGTVRFFIS